MDRHQESGQIEHYCIRNSADGEQVEGGVVSGSISVLHGQHVFSRAMARPWHMSLNIRPKSPLGRSWQKGGLCHGNDLLRS